MLVKFINKIIVTPEELIKLLTFTDEIPQKEAQKAVNRIYRAIKISSLMIIFIYTGIGYLLVNGSKLLITGSSPTSFFSIFLILVIAEFTSSILNNKFIYLSGDELRIDKINLVKESLYKYFNPEQSKTFTETIGNLSRYFFKLNNCIENFYRFIVIIAASLYANTTMNLKLAIFLITTASMIFLVFSGMIYNKSAFNIYEKLLEHKKYSKKDQINRVVFPGTLNVLNEVIFPLIIVILAAYGFNGIIPQMAILIGTMSFGWELVNYFEQFYYAKTNLGKSNSFLETLTKNNVINQAGFVAQTQLVTTTDQLLDQSRQNKSLILKDFIPKYLTNGISTDRKFNIELKPGLYQLTGINGVGKTTLLESITLTEEELVELSYGQAVFNGGPLFDPKSTLKNHRQKYRYIGRYSSEFVLDADIVGYFKKYKHIHNFLKKLQNNPKSKYSEGEKAIVAICHTLFHINESSVIVIDELISRVYEDPFTPLRSDILKIIDHFAHSNGHLVFIVDHVLKIHEAGQIKLTANRISLL